MRPETNREQVKKFGNDFEQKSTIFINISANLLESFSFDHFLSIDLGRYILTLRDGKFVHF